jgi:Domain of unknown function (DUF4189)
MKLRLMLVLMALSSFNDLASACADGYYAGQCADSNSCYPIPGEERQRGQRSNTPSFQPQQKQEKWADTWGAIAIGNENDGTGAGVTGAATNMNNERQASKAALDECQAKGGGKSCKITLTYYNQCVVVAWGDTGNFVARAPTVEIATEMSMANCSAKHANCSVYYWGCSPAKRIF